MAAILILSCWLVVPAFAYTYSNDYPVYLPYVGAKYCEVNSSIGRGSIVVSASVPDRYLSLGISNSNIYNNTSSTLYGVFVLQSGQQYSLRWSSFSTPEYYTAGSYNPVYTALTVNSIINTNIDFVDYNDTGKQNDNFIFDSNIEKASFVLQVFSVLLLISINSVVLIRRFSN